MGIAFETGARASFTIIARRPSQTFRCGLPLLAKEAIVGWDP